MAVQAPVNLKMRPEVDDDDDEPLVFRRSNTSSKQIVGKSGRQGSNARPSNGSSSGILKNRIASSSSAAAVRSPQASSNLSSSSAKTSAMKVSSSSPNASAISAKTSHSKSPVSSSKPVEGQSRQSSKQIPNAVKEENTVAKQRSESNYDSDDDKPLNFRVKVNSIHENKEKSVAAELMGEDSDDDMPLSRRLSMKTPATGSVNKHTDNTEKKPLASKVQQSGSIPKNSQLKSSTSSSKRPIDKSTAFSNNSSVKKAKLSQPTTMKQVSLKREVKEEDDEDDHVPISQRMKKSAGSDKKPVSAKLKAKRPIHSSFKKTVKSKIKRNSEWRKESPSSSDGQKKWTTLVHNGVIFPPPYKPHGVKMLYNGRPVDLTPEQEEVATMFAVMKDTDYMEKDMFKKNFWSDWRKLLGKNHVIQSLEGCDFTPIYDWAQQEKEKKKQMSKEEKLALKEAKMKEEEKYMWAIVDGVKEKVGNFRVEPPGLFRGRGEHPKMGKLKKRVYPSDITINIGKDTPIPESPIPGESWKEIRHDNTVTWLAYWPDTINGKEFKYVFLAASSALKGQSDKEKYEKARMLKDYIDDIRVNYTKDFTCKDITKRQIAVATYLIDKLALRAGNEKDDDEADTVGCCTLKVENVTPIPPEKLKFDFLGKDSIRYVNEVDVLPPVYKAIEQFRCGKKSGDDLFDKLDTSKLNAHLKELMPGLTAKVFRTFNASFTLQDELVKGIKEAGEGDVAGKIAVYNLANKQVAIICNHQRTVSKTHGAQMAKLDEKIEELKGILNELKTDLARAKKGKQPLKNADGNRKRNLNPEALERKIAQTALKIEKMEQQKEVKEDLKTVALGTSKINYCDPRITVAWCKQNEVPIEKIFQKTLLAKFAWAMDTEPDFRF